MRTGIKVLLLVGILVFAAFLRLYHITATPPGLYPDEAMDGNNALEIVHGTASFQPFYVEDNGREGLYVNILVFFIKWFGHEPWVVRLPAAIAGILTVFGMYFLVAELFKKRESGSPETEAGSIPFSGFEFPGPVLALLSAFLLATSFWHIIFSRIGFRAILAPLCLVWAVYFLLKGLRGRRTEDGGLNGEYSILHSPFSMLCIISAGIIYGLGFYTYIAYRITPLLFLLFIPFFRKTPGFWKKMLLFCFAAFIIALPIGVYFLQHPGDFFGRTSQIAVTNAKNPIGDFMTNVAKTLLMLNVRGDNNWRQNIASAPELWWPVGILFITGIIWSIYQLWKSRRSFVMSHLSFVTSLLLSWFLLALLPAAASDEGIPHALRSILMLPPTVIFAAIGGIWAYRSLRAVFFKDRLQWLPPVIAAVFLAAVAIYAYYDYFVVWAENSNVPGAFNADYVAIGNQINALPLGEPKYVVVEAGGVIARGIPVPAETVMFVTDSFTTSTQLARHITYLLPDETGEIPKGTPSSSVFYVK